GADDNAVRVSRELSERGVDVSEALVREAPNQYAVILVDEHSGERTVFWDRDERLALRDGELRPELVAGARVLHVDDVDIDAAIRAARAARVAGTAVTSDIDRLTDRTMNLVSAVAVPIIRRAWPAAPPRPTNAP